MVVDDLDHSTLLQYHCPLSNFYLTAPGMLLSRFPKSSHYSSDMLTILLLNVFQGLFLTVAANGPVVKGR